MTQQIEDIKRYIEEYPEMEQVQVGSPVNMHDGRTLISVILIFPTAKPPDLNIHVSDNISFADHAMRK